MRSIEFLAVAVIFSICLSAMQIKSLHNSFDVQAFSYSFEEITLAETRHGGAEYLSKITFLGDSRTYGLKSFAMLEGGEETRAVWTPKNGTMSIWDMHLQKIVFPETNEELTPGEAAEKSKPEILVIALGFNGFNMVSEEYFASEYSKLVASIRQASPDTKIILQSMLPVCKNYSLLDNETIEKGNEQIKMIAVKSGCFYLNTAEVLRDKDGYLIEKYSTDGCHLTPLGLDVQIEYICTHMIGK